jgi:energy-coupling factor transport system substrate-specific component
VVTAVIGVVFAVVFAVWNAGWEAVKPLFAFFPPGRNIIYGMWLVPAILAPYLVRRPGAALFAEMVAAVISAFWSQWGPDTLLSGFVQGAAAEIVFALALYRVWNWPVLALASIASAAGAWVHDWVVYYADVDVGTQILVGIIMAVSAVIFCVGGSILVERSLRRAGALQGLPA